MRSGVHWFVDVLFALAFLAFMTWQWLTTTKRGDDLYNSAIHWFERESEALKWRARCIWYRKKAGRCLKCGYDLLHNTSGICPECGTPIAKDRCVDI
ncbi:MAG TPA: hypothetical protein VFE47_27355 [Tepidisphaeraceae bacterium]|jgi:hypothetical protein|nr:hypothetical protein [Tepidisphaeraceae bacterium]